MNNNELENIFNWFKVNKEQTLSQFIEYFNPEPTYDEYKKYIHHVLIIHDYEQGNYFHSLKGYSILQKEIHEYFTEKNTVLCFYKPEGENFSLHYFKKCNCSKDCQSDYPVCDKVIDDPLEIYKYIRLIKRNNSMNEDWSGYIYDLSILDEFEEYNSDMNIWFKNKYPGFIAEELY